MPKTSPKKNPALWVNLLTSINRTGHTSGPTSEHYIQGYQTVFKKWGIIKGRNIDLKLINQLLTNYKEIGNFPEFKP